MDASGEEIIPEMEIKSETNSYVDQITLELLMNKSQYHKFVSKTIPMNSIKYKIIMTK